jgi:hypothetical protein
MIHVEVIAAAPAETLTIDHLKPTQVDAALAEEVKLLEGEVGTDCGDHLHGRQDAGRSAEVHGGAAHNFSRFGEWRLDSIDRY